VLCARTGRVAPGSASSNRRHNLPAGFCGRGSGLHLLRATGTRNSRLSHHQTSPLIAAFLAHRAAQALGINDDSLGFVLLTVIFAIGFAFSQWQSYQDDDDDFFDTYDSRRGDRELSNRNRV
jgi:hypothetical protein